MWGMGAEMHLPRAVHKVLGGQTLMSACMHTVLTLGIALVVCSFYFCD